MLQHLWLDGNGSNSVEDGNDDDYIYTPTPPKTNMYTQHDGLEKVAPFKYGPFWYLC